MRHDEPALHQRFQGGSRLGLVPGQLLRGGARPGPLHSDQAQQHASGCGPLVGQKVRDDVVGVSRQRARDASDAGQGRCRDPPCLDVTTIPELCHRELQQRKTATGARGIVDERIDHLGGFEGDPGFLRRLDHRLPEPLGCHGPKQESARWRRRPWRT